MSSRKKSTTICVAMLAQIDSVVDQMSDSGYTQFRSTGVICRSESIRNYVGTGMKITQITTTMLHDPDGVWTFVVNRLDNVIS